MAFNCSGVLPAICFFSASISCLLRSCRLRSSCPISISSHSAISRGVRLSDTLLMSSRASSKISPSRPASIEVRTSRRLALLGIRTMCHFLSLYSWRNRSFASNQRMMCDFPTPALPTTGIGRGVSRKWLSRSSSFAYPRLLPSLSRRSKFTG